uniref:Acyl-CoA-binding domain-containing protein 5 n=1 Tax=Nothobranchius furzeri TaxID=105023 RepID=A0A8C6PBC7_NOTFU
MEVERVSVEEENRLTRMRFDAAVKVIKSLPPNGPFQPSNDIMLKFYSYYKQATIGACNIPRPGFWDAVGKAKWDAWNSLGDMAKEEAMAAYVDQMKLILEGMPMTDEVEELLRVLGPFYELVDEKKKVTQISDLSAGFGTMMTSLESKNVAKSVIRNMEMNGTLETRPARIEQEKEEEEEDEENEEIMEVRKSKGFFFEEHLEVSPPFSAASQPKKKSSARRHKPSLQNGKLSNGVSHATNGSLARAALNSDDSQEDETSDNDLRSSHLASDSDSEVYCDSVDQFGQEENSEHNRSLDDLEEEEEEESHALLPVEVQEDAPLEVIKCGGEEGEADGTRSQTLNVNVSGSSSSRRGQGTISRSPGLGSGPLMPADNGGDGGGERWRGVGTPGANLNEQIVVALARLQEDMHSVLERLRTLEALTAGQVEASSEFFLFCKKPSWWPFDISPTSLAFAVIWPFVPSFLIRTKLSRLRNTCFCLLPR